METLNLNLIPTGANPVAHVSQYDEGRVIRFNLFEGSSVYTLDGTETIECDVKKPDGNVVTLAVTNTSSTYVDVTTTLQMCACSGESLGDIKITKGAVIIATLNFILSVERSPLENGVESDSAIHNLKTTISDMVKEEIEAISPEEELSGAMASFETHEIAPLVDCKVKIEAIQSGSGTPSPDNVRPITGFTGANVTICGKNLFNISNIDSGYSVTDTQFAINGGGYYRDFFQQTNGQLTAINLSVIDKLPFLRAGTYAISYSQGEQVWIGTVNKTDGSVTSIGWVTSGETFTLITDSRITIRRVTNTSVTYENFQLELGLTTTYEAYNGTTYPISWQSEAGTVYWGELDVTSGLLSVDYSGLLDLGDLSWGYNSNYGGIFYATTTASHTKGQAIICDCYQTTNLLVDAPNTDWASVPDLTIGLHYQGGTNYIYVKNSNYTDSAAFASAMSGQKYITAIDNANTYQLTPTEIKTILGVNNIWADTGDIDVVYHHELTARYVYFDNTGTDLTATNVEAAIKELLSRIQ